MSQPTPGAVHVDRVLTNISVAYMQKAEDFIAHQIFPIVPVEKKTDLYFTYTKADWFRDEARRRSDASESAGSGYGVSTAAYSCDVWALHKDIGNQARANSDAPLNPDRDAARFLTQRMLLRQETQFVVDAFGTSVWGTDLTPSSLWSDFAASNPIADIDTGKRTVLLNTGYEPNTLALGYDVWLKLKEHPDIVDRIKYTSSQSVTTQTLATLFGVDKIVVAKAVQNTANEGLTASMSFVWGKHALLTYVNPNPGLLAPSAGYTFVWQGVSQGYGANIGISSFYLPELKADRVEAEVAWDNKIVATDLGYFFNGAVA